MYKVVCFGDSNTFGYIPGSGGGRYEENERWSGILKNLVKDKFVVIEAGCNDRTCFSFNSKGEEFNGKYVIKNYVDKETDILLIALGINDMQISYTPSAADIENGIINLINLAREANDSVKMILVIPSVISNDVLEGEFYFQFNETSIETSKLIPDIYKKVADEYNCGVVDLNEIARVSKKDGLHYDISEHKKIAEFIQQYLNKTSLV